MAIPVLENLVEIGRVEYAGQMGENLWLTPGILQWSTFSVAEIGIRNDTFATTYKTSKENPYVGELIGTRRLSFDEHRGFAAYVLGVVKVGETETRLAYAREVNFDSRTKQGGIQEIETIPFDRIINVADVTQLP